MRKLIIGLSCIILIGIIGYLLYTKPIKCNKSFEGIKFRLGDKTISQNIHIDINGEIKRGFIFSRTSFKGTMKIDDIYFQLVQFSFDDYFETTLLYYSPELLRGVGYGQMFFNKDLSKISISVFEQDSKGQPIEWNGKDNLVISAPADNRDEALSISNQLMQVLKINGIEEFK